jgi:inhibitor of KinA
VSGPFSLEPLGEDAVLLRFGQGIDATINQRVHACAAVLRRDQPAWLLDVVPAFATLALCIDPDALGDTEPLAAVRNWIVSCKFEGISESGLADARHHQIRVHYGGESGPDLDAVAAHAGLTPDEVILRHTSAEYRVGMLGFAAGFPYLIGMDASLAMPRHATPRIDVAAGSVGIAGAQTGIYPCTGPGGWQIIGRTDTRLFDASRTSPSLLEPGDLVRFVDASGCAGSGA